MMRGAKPSLMLRNGKLSPAALVRGRQLATPPLPPASLSAAIPSPCIHPLNNLPPLILIACLLACFLGVVQSERSLLGGDASLNYQESTKLFTVQQEVLWKREQRRHWQLLHLLSPLFFSLIFLPNGRRTTSHLGR